MESFHAAAISFLPSSFLPSLPLLTVTKPATRSGRLLATSREIHPPTPEPTRMTGLLVMRRSIRKMVSSVQRDTVPDVGGKGAREGGGEGGTEGEKIAAYARVCIVGSHFVSPARCPQATTLLHIHNAIFLRLPPSASATALPSSLPPFLPPARF